MINFKLNLS